MSVAVIAASGAGAASASPAATATHQKISSVQTSHGRVISNPAGQVVYMFDQDTRNVSHCNKLCQGFWPPVTSKAAPVAAGVGVSASHLGRTSTGQVTYYGHPLYYYVGDSKPKQTNGEDFNGSGGIWYLVGTNGKAVK